jgi:DNA-binding NarL/FixJ family response regulator
MGTAATVRVMVVDDQAPFRMAARLVIGRTPDFELVGEATSGEESVPLAAELHPDLVLMDINMGEMSGIEATRRIVADQPGVVVFLCSTYAAADLPPGALDSGAASYVHKEELAPAMLSDLWAQQVPNH